MAVPYKMDTGNFVFFCTVCNKQFPDESESFHTETERHILTETFYSNRALFNIINSQHPIKVTQKHFNFVNNVIKVQWKHENVVKFNIRNISKGSVTLLDIFRLTNEQDVQVVNIKKPTNPVVILKGELNNSFNITVVINDFGYFEVPIAFTYSSSSSYESVSKISHFVLVLDFEIETDWTVLLRPKRPYKRESKKSFLHVNTQISGPELKADGDMMERIYLKQYKPPDEMIAILENNLIESKKLNQKELKLLLAVRKVLGQKGNVIDFTRKNYVDRFTYLLFMEEAEELIELEQFRKEKVLLESVRENKIDYFRLQVGDGLVEGRPSLMVGDKALVYPLNGKKYGLKSVWYSGLICKVELRSILLRFRADFHKLLKPESTQVNAKFVPQRLPYRMCHRALEFVKKEQMEFILFPLENFPYKKSPNFVDKLKFSNKDINNNPEQAQAVLNIVNCTSRPYPYLLFGPPGTGKTVTLVEAIIQNWKLKPESRRKQLICASSNAAADIITERLLTKSGIPDSDILRMYSHSTKDSQVSELIRNHEDAHNLVYNNINKSSDIILPSYETIMEKNIVITTIITAGRFIGGNPPIPGTHFSHVLIDEAGHCMEPECLVPFMGLITGPNKRVYGQLVLAGDPQQLGPVLASPAKEYGLQKSLLERLMTSDSMYKKNPETGKYNELVLTKLFMNFRSHPAIIEIPNKLFYDEELKAAGKKQIIESFCNWNKLPTNGFPIIFHGIIGKEDREDTSPSFFNLDEVNLIMHYIEKCLVGKIINGRLIKTTDIGVVSPYKKQIQKLSIALKKKRLDGLTLGSVEQFQGDERLIIILSTVRSKPKDKKIGLGFLKNPKRFNVAVTRAQALLIIIGNPIILAEDENWGKMLRYCYDKGGYTGIPFEYLKNKIDIKLTNRENNVKSLVSSTSLLSLSSRSFYGDEVFDDSISDMLSSASSRIDTLEEEYSNYTESINNDFELIEEDEEEMNGAHACKISDEKLNTKGRRRRRRRRRSSSSKAKHEKKKDDDDFFRTYKMDVFKYIAGIQSGKIIHHEPSEIINDSLKKDLNISNTLNISDPSDGSYVLMESDQLADFSDENYDTAVDDYDYYYYNDKADNDKSLNTSVPSGGSNNGLIKNDHLADCSDDKYNCFNDKTDADKSLNTSVPSGGSNNGLIKNDHLADCSDDKYNCFNDKTDADKSLNTSDPSGDSNNGLIKNDHLADCSDDKYNCFNDKTDADKSLNASDPSGDSNNGLIKNDHLADCSDDKYNFFNDKTDADNSLNTSDPSGDSNNGSIKNDHLADCSDENDKYNCFNDKTDVDKFVRLSSAKIKNMSSIAHLNKELSNRKDAIENVILEVTDGRNERKEMLQKFFINNAINNSVKNRLNTKLHISNEDLSLSNNKTGYLKNSFNNIVICSKSLPNLSDKKCDQEEECTNSEIENKNLVNNMLKEENKCNVVCKVNADNYYNKDCDDIDITSDHLKSCTEITTDEFNCNETVKIMLVKKTNEIDQRCNVTLTKNTEIMLNELKTSVNVINNNAECNNKHSDKIMFNDFKTEDKVDITEKITLSNNTKIMLSDSKSCKTGVKNNYTQDTSNSNEVVKLHHYAEDIACNSREYSDESKQGISYVEEQITSIAENEEKPCFSKRFDNVLNNDIEKHVDIPSSTNKCIYNIASSLDRISHNHSFLPSSSKKNQEISSKKRKEIKKREKVKERKDVGVTN
ncbi:uncharacterized protein LOC142332554 isoform X2 [Lycorma delicatula]|uniref:uncharacterized protein LOC142332554 isoform X2 n=1 Tax=Lycorma delicatula TaxID=130591 RepID=UPI003F515375